MRFVEFRDVICQILRRNPSGLTWAQLKERLDLPYDRPCDSWIRRLEDQYGLKRAKGATPAYVWSVRKQERSTKRRVKRTSRRARAGR
jgi:hypothetical protein